METELLFSYSLPGYSQALEDLPSKSVQVKVGSDLSAGNPG